MISHLQIGDNAKVRNSVDKSNARTEIENINHQLQQLHLFGSDIKAVSPVQAEISRRGQDSWERKIIAKYGLKHPHLTKALLIGRKAFSYGLIVAIPLAGAGVIKGSGINKVLNTVNEYVISQVDAFMQSNSTAPSTSQSHTNSSHSNATITPVAYAEPVTQTQIKSTNISATQTRSSGNHPPLIEEVASFSISTNGLVEKDVGEETYLIPEIDAGFIEAEIEEDGDIVEKRSWAAKDTQTLERLLDGSVVVSEKTDDGWRLAKLKPSKDSFTVEKTIEVDETVAEIIYLEGHDLIATRPADFDGETVLRDPDTLEVVQILKDTYLMEDSNNQIYNINITGDHKNPKITIELVNSNLDVIASSEPIDSPYAYDLAISLDSQGSKVCLSVESTRSLHGYEKNTTIVFQKEGDQLVHVTDIPMSGVCTFLGEDGDHLLMQKLVENEDGKVVVEKKVLNIESKPYVTKVEENAGLELILFVNDDDALGMRSGKISTYKMPQPEEINPSECTITKDQPIELGQTGIVTSFKQTVGEQVKGTETIFHSLVSGIVPKDALEPKLIMEEQNTGQIFEYDITPDARGHFTTETEAEQINFGVLNIGVHGIGNLVEQFGNRFDMKFKISFIDENGHYQIKDIGLRAKAVDTDVVANYGMTSGGKNTRWDVDAEGEVHYMGKYMLTFSDIHMARIKVEGKRTWMHARLIEGDEQTGEFYGYADPGYVPIKGSSKADETVVVPKYGVYSGATLLAIVTGVVGIKKHIHKREKILAHTSGNLPTESAEAQQDEYTEEYDDYAPETPEPYQSSTYEEVETYEGLPIVDTITEN